MDQLSLSDALKAGKRVYGTLVVSPSPKWAEEIHRLAVDFVFIDTEHIPIDRFELSWMCRTYSALHLEPIVRIPSPDPYQASMALDAGACGILAPYVETVDQVQALRGAVKLRPLKGKKHDAVLEGSLELDAGEKAYLEEFNRNKMLFVNIESQAGIDALDEMLQVPGVDGVIIGPHDLSVSLGIPEKYDHPRFEQAVISIIKTSRRHGVAVGNHYSYGVEREIQWAEAGMNIILHSADITGFLRHIGSELADIRKALGDQEDEVSTAEDVNI